jgi:hypothetical protein
VHGISVFEFLGDVEARARPFLTNARFFPIVLWAGHGLYCFHWCQRWRSFPGSTG